MTTTMFRACFASLKLLSLWAIGFLLLLSVLALDAPSQTFTMLHEFTGGADGGNSTAGLVRDGAGNFYGTTQYGGVGGNCAFQECGVVFRMVQNGSNWVLTPIHNFAGPPNDGATPLARVIFGPDGALYGTTANGGASTSACTAGCGTVFKLQPPFSSCKTVLCPWKETILYQFAGGSDGSNPQNEVAFDAAGEYLRNHAVGRTNSCNCGTVFRLTHNSDGSWSKGTLYSFQGGLSDGQRPYARVVLDSRQHLWHHQQRRRHRLRIRLRLRRCL